MAQLRITDTLATYLTAVKQNNLRHRLAKKMLDFLQELIGGKLYIEVPRGLNRFDEISNSILSALKLAEKFQRDGIIHSIRKIGRRHDEPFKHSYAAPPPGAVIGGYGADFFSEELAMWRALGEAFERYIWRHDEAIEKRIIRAPLSGPTANSLDARAFAGFTDKQREENRALSILNTSEIGWINGYSLTKEQKTYVPAQIVSAYYFDKYAKLGSQKGPEPVIRSCITTGLGSGPSLEDAVLAGLLEVIERDAFMITYLNKLTPTQLDLEYLARTDEECAQVINSFKRHLLELHVVKLPTDFPISVFAAIAIDKTGNGPTFTIGARAHFDTRKCFFDAMVETLAVRGNFRSKTVFKNQKQIGNVDREGRLALWAQPEQINKGEFLISGKKEKIDLEPTAISKRAQIDMIVEHCNNEGYDAGFVELTPEKYKKYLRSVMAVIPQLQPLHLDESRPCLGGERLRSVPERLGYTPAEVLNTEPHPFP